MGVLTQGRGQELVVRERLRTSSSSWHGSTDGGGSGLRSSAGGGALKGNAGHHLLEHVDDDEATVAPPSDKMTLCDMMEAAGERARAVSRVTSNEFVSAKILAYLAVAEMLGAATTGRCFVEALGRVTEVKMGSRCLCMPSLMGRFSGARCLTIEGGIDLFNAMGLLAWPLQTSLKQVSQLNFEISGNEIGDDTRGFQHWERGLTTLARSGALRQMEYVKFSFRGRLEGVAQYLTHAAFEGIFLADKPWRLLSLECALLVAASHPEIAPSIAVELLRRGADPNAVAPNSISALHLAAEANCREVVKALLDAGADPNAAAPGNCKTALHAAVANTYWYSFRDDDRRDAPPPATRIVVYSTPMPPPILEKRKRPPLVRYERAAIVRLLLAAGADVNARDADGNTPLLAALASYGDLDYDGPSVIKTAQVLLAAGADVSLRNNHGDTALAVAVDLDKPIEVLGTLAEAEVANASTPTDDARRHHAHAHHLDGKRPRVSR